MSRHLRPFLLLLLLLIPASAVGATYPKPTGFVNDFAQVLQPDSRQRLESMLTAFQRESDIEVAVVTLPTLNNEPIENVAVALFQQWGIGKKGKDNGVLFLIAPNDRRMRIEVGYGLEGVLNDALTGRILDTAVVPHFKAGDLDAGIAAGTAEIVSTIAAKEGISFHAEATLGTQLTLSTSSTKSRGPFSIIFKILMAIVMIYLFIRHPWLFLLLISSAGRGGGGGFGGGFGGFGGGLSGGGGSSRGW